MRCEPDTGLDDNYLCLKPERFGAELEFRVNATTEKVLMTIVKNDGNYFYKDYFLEGCSVVDTTNWKCTDGPITFRTVHAMSHGHYYDLLTGGHSGDYYKSSISGETLSALRNHSISVLTAMERTGYSRKSLATFDLEEKVRTQ